LGVPVSITIKRFSSTTGFGDGGGQSRRLGTFQALRLQRGLDLASPATEIIANRVKNACDFEQALLICALDRIKSHTERI
jgi:hypothetical protein